MSVVRYLHRWDSNVPFSRTQANLDKSVTTAKNLTCTQTAGFVWLSRLLYITGKYQSISLWYCRSVGDTVYDVLCLWLQSMVNRTSADSESLLGDSYLCSKYTTYITSHWKIFTRAIYSTNTIVSPTCRRILTYECHVAHVKTYSANTPSNAFTCYRRRNKQLLQHSESSINIAAKQSLTRGNITTRFVIHNMFYRKISFGRLVQRDK